MPELLVINILISFFLNILEKHIYFPKEIELVDQKVAQSRKIRYPKKAFNAKTSPAQGVMLLLSALGCLPRKGRYGCELPGWREKPSLLLVCLHAEGVPCAFSSSLDQVYSWVPSARTSSATLNTPVPAVSWSFFSHSLRKS